MIAAALPPPPDLKGQVDPVEWQARVELAALFRLVALQGWDDAIYTHISMRVPGSPDHVLLNPFGMMFDEITASSLVKIDLDGNIVQNTPYRVNGAGFVIHSAIHRARPDLQCVIHMHTDWSIAVSVQACGLLPLAQAALTVLPHVAYHDYEGFATHLDERERLAADLGDRRILFLRNHGTLVTGPTAADAWDSAYILERACRQQILALSAGPDGLVLAPGHAQREVVDFLDKRAESAVGAAWQAWLRRLARRSPGYDD